MPQLAARVARSTTSQPVHPLPKATPSETDAPSSGHPRQPELTTESLAAAGRELTPLFVKFWQEHGRQEELDIDWLSLMRLEAMGQLLLLTVRENESIVGFVLSIIQPRHLFFGICTGTTIAYWLDPAWRRGWFAMRVFNRNLECLSSKGVKRVYMAVRSERVGKIAKRLGYEEHETHWTKTL